MREALHYVSNSAFYLWLGMTLSMLVSWVVRPDIPWGSVRIYTYKATTVVSVASNALYSLVEGNYVDFFVHVGTLCFVLAIFNRKPPTDDRRLRKSAGAKAKAVLEKIKRRAKAMKPSVNLPKLAPSPA